MGAAALALEQGFISIEGALRVADAATLDFEAITFPGEERRAARLAEIERDRGALAEAAGRCG